MNPGNVAKSKRAIAVTFAIPKWFMTILRYMASQDFRTLDEELMWLIEQERRKRWVNKDSGPLPPMDLSMANASELWKKV